MLTPRSFRTARATTVMGIILASALLAAEIVAPLPSSARGTRTSRPATASPLTSDPAFEATRMPLADWQARQATYIQAATANPMDPKDADSVMAYAEKARTDPSLLATVHTATATTFAHLLGPDADADFTITTLLTLYLHDNDELDPGLAAAIRTRLLTFKYWWTEPQPTGVIDPQYYWTENHQMLYLSSEYLAGQTLPDAVFTNSGMTGRQHMAHALARLKRWIELRGRYGFSEFLANPYTAITFEGLLNLAEFATDPEVAHLAANVADMQLVEVGSHLHDGVFGAAKGRTYMGDLFDPHGGVTPALIALTFGTTTPPTGSSPSAAFATAHNYRPPDVAIRLAHTTQTGIVRQHQGIPLDPTAPVTPNPTGPDGLTFAGEDGLMVWWAMGAQLSWQVAPLSVQTIEQYNLWDTPNFQIDGANLLEGIVKGKTTAQLQALAQSLAHWLNPGLLSAVDTYTWRSADNMLSTAQDFRPGQRTESALISMATLDRAATTFITLPKGKPPTAGGGAAYWQGDGAAPRAAQHTDTTISIYSPQFTAGGPDGPNGYQSYTHAFFPTERFDEVVQRNGWTFGRNGNGYVALWSWRPAHFVALTPGVPQEDNLSKPFELEADGGPDDVWITRVGRAADFGKAADPFTAFMDSVTAQVPQVQPMAGGTACPASTPSAMGSCKHGLSDGFLVRYAPPAHEALGFGWAPKSTNPDPPLTVDGNTVALHDPAHRWDSTWASAGVDGKYHVSIEGETLDITLPVPAAATVPPPTTPTTPVPNQPASMPATPISTNPRLTG